MANLKEIRNRITSVGSTMQITSAMKMVSAAKLKRAQDAITQMRPYAEKLQEILDNLRDKMNVKTLEKIIEKNKTIQKPKPVIEAQNVVISIANDDNV